MKINTALIRQLTIEEAAYLAGAMAADQYPEFDVGEPLPVDRRTPLTASDELIARVAEGACNVCGFESDDTCPRKDCPRVGTEGCGMKGPRGFFCTSHRNGWHRAEDVLLTVKESWTIDARDPRNTVGEKFSPGYEREGDGTPALGELLHEVDGGAFARIAGRLPTFEQVRDVSARIAAMDEAMREHDGDDMSDEAQLSRLNNPVITPRPALITPIIGFNPPVTDFVMGSKGGGPLAMLRWNLEVRCIESNDMRFGAGLKFSNAQCRDLLAILNELEKRT